MHGWMQTKLGLGIVGAASVLLLGSCLVNSNKTAKSYTTTSTTLPAYSDGHHISMAYERYSVGASSEIPNGGITMKWNQTALILPFTGAIRSSVLRYVFEEAGGSSIQYITQNESRSIFLHALEGIGTTAAGLPKNSFWPDRDEVLLSGEPESIQVFWSPITPGIDHSKDGALDYFIMGECDSGGCKSVATMKTAPYIPPNPPQSPEDVAIPGFEITVGGDADKQMVNTPLGNFQSYHLRYRGTLIVTRPYTGSSFDYRTSCLTPGTVGRADYDGEVWIYPPIGPVKIRNYCFPSGPSGGKPISYTAQITGTNLPF